MKIVLIHPPVVKPSEPPAGIGRLSACLQNGGISHEVIDANLEGMHHLLSQRAQMPSSQRWDLRACKNLEANLAALQTIGTYKNKSRYSRAAVDVNRVLTIAGAACGLQLSLADYVHEKLSPVQSRDLIYAAEHPRDNPFYSYFQSRLTAVIEQSPEFIGFSLNYLSQALCTMAMVGFIKKINPSQKIILGGSLVTSWVKIKGHLNFFNGWIDEIVAGPGEEKLLRLMGAENVSSSGLSTNYTRAANHRYLSPGLILPYSSARGCWWRKCAFCPEKSEENPYLPQPAFCVTGELQTLTKNLQPSLIHLLDSSIAPSLMKALAANPPGAPWYGFARATPHLADDDFCRSLKKSGCVMLKLGIESGDQEVLDKLDKGIELASASNALQALKQAGIATYCYFLFGTPPENEKSALKTMDFICRHIEYIDYLNLAIFNLPAASIEAQSFATEDFYDGDLSLYKSFRHPAGWQRRNIRMFLEKTLKKHQAIAPVVSRTPEFFTSNHAPFFNF